METEKLRCPKCGYIFENKAESENSSCPLCGTEYEFTEAQKLYAEVKDEFEKTAPKENSTKKIILEWIAVFGGFIIFIFLLYCIFSYIFGV